MTHDVMDSAVFSQPRIEEWAASAGDLACGGEADALSWVLPPSSMPIEAVHAITGRIEHALELHRTGLRLLPLLGKQAFIRGWQHLQLGESDVRDWARRDVNFGIITGDPLVVLDTDSEEAEAWVKGKGIDSPVVIRSGGGGLHRYFVCPPEAEVRSRIGMHKIPGLDVKAWNSYIVAPGSIHPVTHRPYEYLPGRELTELHKLPVFDPSWAAEIRPPLPKLRLGEKRVSGHIRDVRAYIRGIASIEGQGGDKACFTVACLLVEAGFSPAEALAEMESWNQQCAFPPWSTRELQHKVRYAVKRVTGE